jgi:hypothetical protein
MFCLHSGFFAKVVGLWLGGELVLGADLVVVAYYSCDLPCGLCLIPAGVG